MKKLAMLVLAVGTMVLSTGCATPAYTGAERAAMIGRNMSFEMATINDDIDYLFLLRPVSNLSRWHIRG